MVKFKFLQSLNNSIVDESLQNRSVSFDDDPPHRAKMIAGLHRHIKNEWQTTVYYGLINHLDFDRKFSEQVSKKNHKRRLINKICSEN